MSTHNQRLGRWGEQVARRHLERSGLRVLDANWRGTRGEIDLVLREGETLVVCEVKTRSTQAYGSPHEAVTQVKAERLHALAREWVGGHPEQVPDDVDVRIDLVAVLRLPGVSPRLEHVRGAC